MMPAIAQDELDHGVISVTPGAERTCAVTRKLKPVAEMIRFVVGPTGDVIPDIKRKLPGRGIWVTATRAAIDNAITKNVFGRSFRQEVHVARDLAVQTERLLERAALDALAIAGKAGTVISGYSKVEAGIRPDNIQALIHAADAGDDGKRKLAAALQRNRAGESHKIMVIDGFTGAQLSLALGRPNVVHASLLAGPGSETFLVRVSRLTRYRTGFSPDTVGAHAQTDSA